MVTGRVVCVKLLRKDNVYMVKTLSNKAIRRDDEKRNRDVETEKTLLVSDVKQRWVRLTKLSECKDGNEESLLGKKSYLISSMYSFTRC